MEYYIVHLNVKMHAFLHCRNMNLLGWLSGLYASHRLDNNNLFFLLKRETLRSQ